MTDTADETFASPLLKTIAYEEGEIVGEFNAEDFEGEGGYDIFIDIASKHATMDGAQIDSELAAETIARMFEGGNFECRDCSEAVWEQRMNGW